MENTLSNKLPVAVLSDFLRVVKTTVLSHIFNNRENKRVAVIVNDMCEINIDAAIVQNEVSFNCSEEKNRLILSIDSIFDSWNKINLPRLDIHVQESLESIK
tara:strand:- start:836 stop:1141 length:306 start_codon:yes stop_codon:yes gene_type:complete